MMKMLQAKLKAFLDGPQRNAWIADEQVEIYVRNSFHVLDGASVRTLDIANANLLTAERSGAYLQFILGLPHFLRANPSYPQVIYIENVYEPYLCEMFLQFGYQQVPSAEQEFDICFYKRL